MKDDQPTKRIDVMAGVMAVLWPALMMLMLGRRSSKGDSRQQLVAVL